MTLTCEQCTDRLIDYHYRELSKDDLRSVAQHLSHCSDCALAYCRLEADLTGLSALLDAEPSPEVLVELKSKVRQRFRPRSGWTRLLEWRIPVYQPLAAAAAGLALWVVVRPATPPEPMPTPAPAAEIRNYDAPTIGALPLNVL